MRPQGLIMRFLCEPHGCWWEEASGCRPLYGSGPPVKNDNIDMRPQRLHNEVLLRPHVFWWEEASGCRPLERSGPPVKCIRAPPDRNLWLQMAGPFWNRNHRFLYSVKFEYSEIRMWGRGVLTFKF